MALYPDQKFSTFVDGGDLLDGDIIVGLRNGLNTQFNWPGTLPPSFIVPLSQGGTGADLIAVNDSVFSINGLGVSVLTQTLPIPVQQNITTVGTVTSGIWNGTLIDPVHGGTGVSSVTTSPTASEFAGWDVNSNLSANNFLPRFTTTASSGGTKILTVSSAGVQEITGTLTHTIQMPDVTTLTLGHPFKIINNSSGNVTLTSFGGNTILTMAGNTTALVTCVATTGTTATSWNASYIFDNGAGVLSITGTANQVIASASTGAVTLSLPQDIATTSSPTFAGMTLTNPYISGAGGYVSTQILTSGTGATYTKPANVKSILVECIGGGGGGGGSGGNVSSVACAGPGGGGGYVKHFIANAAATYTYTIGAGGTGAPIGNNTGGTGGTTTFSGGSLSATGGVGGTGMPGSTSVARANGGSGGVGTNGNLLNIPGSAGGNSMANVSTNFGGTSGTSILGGSVSTLTLGNGIAGAAYGAGGSGGQSSNTSFGGGAGASGVIIVTEFA